MPFLSVIVPTAATDDKVVAMLDALAAQTFQNVELVLVDLKRDERGEWVSREAGDRFIALRHARFEGEAPIDALGDAGVVASTGEVLLFCDIGQRPDLTMFAKAFANPEINDAMIDGIYSARRAHVVAARAEQLSKYRLDETAPIAAASPKSKPMRIAMIYGEFSSHGHGPYDIGGLYTKMGLTGSEGSFFNLARTLGERGHEVVVFCDTPAPTVLCQGVEVLPIRAIQALPQVQDLSAVIAWNEPDYLQFAPNGVKRYCDQQLNDFGYCRNPNWRQLVDRWVSPSEDHAKNVMEVDLAGARFDVIPNSVDLDLFAGPSPERNPHRVVWCSSPDRGLHHLLSFWPEIRKRVPDAELRVFYRLSTWIERARGNDDEVGRRARYIEAVLPKLSSLGVRVMDLVPNKTMADELRSAACLAYPCDPVRYTEGFGCSVLDAATAGCVPIISAADALPTVHGDSAIGIAGPPQERRAAWIEAICGVLENPVPPEIAAKMAAHAAAHSRQVVCDRWEALLRA